MPVPDFLFRSASFNTAGLTVLLARAGIEVEAGRRPVGLRLTGRPMGSGPKGSVEATVRMSRSEAYAFSEWLDAAVTQSPAKRGSKDQEDRQ